MSHLLPSKLPVRQNGCVKDAEGVKYFSSVLRCVEGGDCVRRWMICGISASEFGGWGLAGGFVVVDGRLEGGFGGEGGVCLRGSSIVGN